jgi:transposase
MSLPDFDVQGSLFESLGSIAADLFDDQDKYKLFARKVWPLLAAKREELAQCYQPDNGRPGIEPVVLLGVLIFQFLERVPDRQAAELVKYHLGWKLALNLKLGAEGFHPTTLVNFRQRLLEAGKSDLALRAVLGALEKEGFIAKRSKQRLDSTHILGAVARLSALECVRETLALALEELERKLAEHERPDFWEQLWERYVESKLDYKTSAEVLQSKRRQAGVDCLRLLNWLEPLAAEIRQTKAVALLRSVFAQQFELAQGDKTSSSSVESIEPVKVHATGVVQNPHDPEAQWSAKGEGKQKKDWVGYKAQVAETVGTQEDPSSFITSVVTQRATESDDAGLPASLQKQEALGLERPSELYADGAYISGQAIQQAAEEGWQLLGPAQPSAARKDLAKEYRIEAFDISVRERKAVCPAGKTSTNCSKLTEEKSGKVSYRFEFGRQCHDCPYRAACVPSAQAHRTIVVGACHEALQQRRREQLSPEFALRMHQRNGIEGTISELVRGHGLRRARYKGLAKVDLQNQFIAAACNIKRWFQKLQSAAFRGKKEGSTLSSASAGSVLANFFVQIVPRRFLAQAFACNG